MTHQPADSVPPLALESNDEKNMQSCEEDVRSAPVEVKKEGAGVDADNGRERLKRQRIEVAGRVWIPDIWGQEEMLKDWIDCSAFDASLVPRKILSAREALAEEGRRANSGRLTIENRCRN